MADPGVGKSRLFYEFKATSQSGWMVLEAYSVSHGKASAYLPVLELLSEYFEISRDDDDRKRAERILGKVLRLDRNLEDSLPYLYSLHGMADANDPLAQMDPLIRRRRTLDAIKRILLRESLNQPLMVIFEDLHWIDAETQALLNLLVDAIANTRILLLVNYRPEYRHEWGSRTHYTQLRLDPLAKENAEEMLSALLGDKIDLAQLKRLIIERTEGIPFFMEEIVQALIEQGVLSQNGAVKLLRPLTEVKVPATVQAVLASRIDRLPADGKDLLQTLAVIGREFTLQLVQRVWGRSEAELEHILASLQSGEFICERPAFTDAEYVFKHALTQEIAYNSLLLAKRKILHERTGAAIETNAVRLEEQFEELAHHFGRSDNFEKAFEYTRQAAEQGLKRSHYNAALTHAVTALDLLGKLPKRLDHARGELALQLVLARATTLGAAGRPTAHMPDVELALRRAFEICEEIGDPASKFRVMANLWTHYFMRGELGRSHELATQLVEVAETQQSEAFAIEAQFVLGDTLYWLGRFPEALSNFEKVIAEYRLSLGILNLHGWDSLALSLAYRGLCMWLLGRPSNSLEMMSKAVERSKMIGHRESLSVVQLILFQLHWLNGKSEAALTQAQLFSDLYAELEGPLPAREIGQAFADCALLQDQPTESVVEELSKIVDHFRQTGANLMSSIYLAAVAEAKSKMGEVDGGLATLEDAFALIEVTSERVLEAELHRLRGELLQRANDTDLTQAESCFHRAVEVARRQDAKMFELRATISLARLLAQQGRRKEAQQMLAEIYNWFTEGFDAADLKDAKALLEELGAKSNGPQT